MKSTGFRCREKRASQQTLKAGWGHWEIFCDIPPQKFRRHTSSRNNLVDRGKQGRAFTAWRMAEAFARKNTVIFVQLLAWFPSDI
jgi:hypothetical protein